MVSLRLSIVGLLLFFNLKGQAQCLTDFAKLHPEPTTDYAQDFGRATAMYNDILAVSNPNSDTLGRLVGIVNLYQKTGSSWTKIGVLKPSDPLDALQFGVSIDITTNYIVVGAGSYGGSVYVFKKPASGWATSTELTKLTAANTLSFSRGSFGNAIDLSDDEQTLAVVDPNYGTNEVGALFVFHKTATDEWSNSITPTFITAPASSSINFGTSGVAIQGTRVACANVYANSGTGAIYIFNDPSGTFSDFHLEATLAPGEVNKSVFMGYNNFVFTPEGIFAVGYTPVGGLTANKVLFFEQPVGAWSDSTPTCIIHSITDPSAIQLTPVRLAYDGSLLYCSYQDLARVGNLVALNKTSDWCNASAEVIYSLIPADATVTNYFGNSLACDSNGNVCMGHTPLPDNPKASLALIAFSRASSGTWTSSTIYDPTKSATGSIYGSEVISYGNFMFVSAPKDGTAKEHAGAVYIYQKQNGSFTKTGKIIPPITSYYDDDFGNSLACNGTYLAVGAFGFEPNGQVFVYKKSNSDWSSPEFVQRISPPDSAIETFAVNLAMNDKWLAVTFVRNPHVNGVTTGIAIYQYDGSSWKFFQWIETGNANIFAKESTPDIDIEGETILSGPAILQRDASGKWSQKLTLRASDQELAQIAPDFSHWVSDGDQFGSSVDITENVIFIGAPAKDNLGKWNVGAVYVYVKQPGAQWTSIQQTETSKLLPRIQEESGLFGYSLKGLFNTLIVGAPGADYLKTGAARNLPGRAFIIQSKDYLWKQTINLVDITGDTFVKDYYGIDVSLDSTDFFISASIEDNGQDKLTGAVYVTAAPPMVKLMPPICSYGDKINLFGYPFGGTWSGTGITNVNTGEFDPSVGVGSYEMTYSTESCAYQGKLIVEVRTPPPALWKTDTLMYLCEKGATSTALSMNSLSGLTYQWYFREKSNLSFTPVASGGGTFNANKPGQYQVTVSDQYCSATSPTTDLQIQKVDISFPSIPIVCDPNVKSATLTARPDGGKWSCQGLTFSGNTVSLPIAVSPYQLTYTYTSAQGCIFSKNTEFDYNPLPTFTEDKSGDVCDGTAELTIGPIKNDLHYHWAMKPAGSLNFQTLNVDSASARLKIEENGTYQVRVNNSSCSITLDQIIINDQFTSPLSPGAPEVEMCKTALSHLVFERGKPEDTYQWYFSPDLNKRPDQLLSEVSDQLIPELTGYYQAVVTRGNCTLLSDKKFVHILPTDSVFVPNVITPNNDNFNDVLRAVGNVNKVDLTVVNRYGEEMFRGDGTTGWDGGHASPGVYFWYAVFRGCTGNREEMRGFVQVIR